MFNKIKLFLFLLLGLCVAMPTFATPLSLTEQEVNDYLAKKHEVQDKIGFPGLFSMDYKLKNVNAKIGQNNSGRVELSGSVDSSLVLHKKALVGKLNLSFDTIPYYDAQKGAIYLKDLRILSWSGEPDSYMSELQSIMPFLSQSIAALLESMPIYTLDDTKPRDVIIKKFAKGIKVEPGRLSLETNVL
ncbi:DUF1439 domain-containing protein [Pasteurellaceae bacterium 22721_9_1]